MRHLKITALIVLGLVTSGLALLLLLGYLTGLVVIAPWSKQYFYPVNPISLHDLSPHALALHAQSSPCNLVWMTALKGSQETTYESGPDYNLFLTPSSLSANPITAWTPTAITIDLNGQFLFDIDGDLIGNAIPATPLGRHATSDEINIYPHLLVNLGTLETAQPGDTLTVTLHAEILARDSEYPCHEVRRFQFQCFYESGLLKTYR